MKVNLTKGYSAQIDDADAEQVLKHTWHALVANRTKSEVYVYAATSIKGVTVLLHRFLLKPDSSDHVDHINGDRLDNRRANLRACSIAENLRNRKRHYNSVSGMKGVYPKGKRWRSTIMCSGISYWLGSFRTKQEAHAAYTKAAQRLHLQFARTE